MGVRELIVPDPVTIVSVVSALGQLGSLRAGKCSYGYMMSTEFIAEQLAGVPVYALSNADEEFVLMFGARTRRSLGLFCFKKGNTVAQLEHVKMLDPGSRNGSKIAELALHKVIGCRFRE